MAEERPSYTPESANALLPEVREHLEGLRDAFALVAGHRAKVASLAPTNGGDRESGAWIDAGRRATRELRWFNEAGIVVRDIEQGLIDFPSVRQGREVFLCWRLGEDRVAFWHGPDSGFAGRRPL